MAHKYMRDEMNARKGMFYDVIGSGGFSYGKYNRITLSLSLSLVANPGLLIESLLIRNK